MSELGAGTRGSSLSYRSIVTASHNLNSDFFLKNKVEEISNENNTLFRPGLTKNAKYINEIILMYKRISNKRWSTCQRSWRKGKSNTPVSCHFFI